MAEIAVPATVLIVDDEEMNRELAGRLVGMIGCRAVLAANGEEAIGKALASPPDLILLDITMPKMDGVEVCRRLREAPATRRVPIVVVTAMNTLDDRRRAIEAGADDFMGKPFHILELQTRVKALLRLKRMTEFAEEGLQTLFLLARQIEERDGHSEEHTQRVADLSVRLGREIGVADEGQLDALRVGGALHDIGKVGVPCHILGKRGKLDDGEIECARLHSAIGSDLCRPLRSRAGTLQIVRHHHEKMDGSGYPDRLRGDQIPQGARIVAVADIFDTLISPRLYRKAYSLDQAADILRREAAEGLLDTAPVSVILGSIVPRMRAEANR